MGRWQSTWSAHNFSSTAVPMYYAWDCCAYFKGLLDSGVHRHTYTRWYFELALYGVGACV